MVNYLSKWTKLAEFRNIEDVELYYTLIPSINKPLIDTLEKNTSPMRIKTTKEVVHSKQTCVFGIQIIKFNAEENQLPASFTSRTSQI